MDHKVRTKRIYDPVAEDDGTRVLVDRLWPRGVRKTDACIDYWYKQLAPSKTLRQWFNHDPERWLQFRRAYRDELAQLPGLLGELMELTRQGPITLVYGAKDREHNHAAVLREVLIGELAEADGPNEPSSPVCYANPSGEWE